MLVHYGMAAEEGVFTSALNTIHGIFFCIFNGGAGLVWWITTPSEWRAGVGWPIFFGFWLLLGVFLWSGWKAEVVIIANLREKLGDYAIERFSVSGKARPVHDLSVSPYARTSPSSHSLAINDHKTTGCLWRYFALSDPDHCKLNLGLCCGRRRRQRCRGQRDCCLQRNPASCYSPREVSLLRERCLALCTDNRN